MENSESKLSKQSSDMSIMQISDSEEDCPDEALKEKHESQSIEQNIDQNNTKPTKVEATVLAEKTSNGNDVVDLGSVASSESLDKTLPICEDFITVIEDDESQGNDLSSDSNDGGKSLLIESNIQRRSDAEDSDHSDLNKHKKRAMNQRPEVDSVKKARLSQTNTSNILQKQTETTKFESTVERSDRLNINDVPLSPTAQEDTTEKESLPLQFLKIFKKSFQHMTRSDLEELVLQKVVEAIMHKSDVVQLKEKTEEQENIIFVQRRRIDEMFKLCRGIDSVQKRFLSELEMSSDKTVTPEKITRSVALQIKPAKSAEENEVDEFIKKYDLINPRKAPTLNIDTGIPKKFSGLLQKQNVPKKSAAAVPANFKGINDGVTNGVSSLNKIQQIQLEQQKRAQEVQMINLQKEKAFERYQKQQELFQSNKASRKTSLTDKPDENKLNLLVLLAPGSQRLAISEDTVNTEKLSTNGSNGEEVPVESSPILDLTAEDEIKVRQPPHLNGLERVIKLTDAVEKKPVEELPKPSNNILSTADISRSAQILRTITQNIQPTGKNIGLSQFVQVQPKINITEPPIQAIRRPTLTTSSKRLKHPAPLPIPTNKAHNPKWKKSPPRPNLSVKKDDSEIKISWKFDEPTLSLNFAKIVRFQVYAYQETNKEPSVDMWSHVGDPKATDEYPMSVVLTDLLENQHYYFAIRGIDEHGRCGLFSVPVHF